MKNTLRSSTLRPPSSSSDLIPCQYAQLHDEDLMSAIQMRDTRALETLLQRYRGLLKSVILRIVQDHATADDVMQECLVTLWNQADHYSAAKGKPLGWILTLGRRRAIDHLRRSMSYASARGRLETEIKLHAFTQAVGSDCEEADIGQVLLQHLDRLPPPQKLVISLAFLKGMSQREVAQVTQTPLGTVKTRMELGLKKLRAAFRTRNAIHTFQCV